MNRPHRLSKSRVMAGLQCRKRLWWEVHEPDSPELAPDDRLRVIFDRGHRVGGLARAFVPGGVLIDLPYYDVESRVLSTARALADGAATIYEASFFEAGIFVSVDILQRVQGGFVVVEVKSTLDVKDTHIPDVAIQTHVAGLAGLRVARAEVMHLNRSCVYPDLSNLFVRDDVTEDVLNELETLPAQAESLLSTIAGPQPAVATGPHCTAPYQCPFITRCWLPRPRHHVTTLYGLRADRAAALVEDGYETLYDLPAEFKGSEVATRQIRSVQAGKPIVEPGLQVELARFRRPIAFLDFETVNPAVPMWRGCHPYERVPVQFSCDVLEGEAPTHHEWLASGPADPREQIAISLIAVCQGAETLLAYNAPFERGCIDDLLSALPHLKPELLAIRDRIKDLLPVVRNCVYHPDFCGRFGLKDVVPVLVPDFSYSDLAIQDGDAAAAALESLLFDAESFAPNQLRSLRDDLLSYCRRDTLAMVRLFNRLQELAK